MATRGPSAPLPAALPHDPAALPCPCTLLDLGSADDWALSARLLTSVLHLTAQAHERLAPAPLPAAAARCLQLYAGRLPTTLQLAASKRRQAAMAAGAGAEALRPRTVAQLAAGAPARRARLQALAARGWVEDTPPPLPIGQGRYAQPPHPLVEGGAGTAGARAAAAAGAAGAAACGGAVPAAQGGGTAAEAAEGDEDGEGGEGDM